MADVDSRRSYSVVVMSSHAECVVMPYDAVREVIGVARGACALLDGRSRPHPGVALTSAKPSARVLSYRPSQATSSMAWPQRQSPR